MARTAWHIAALALGSLALGAEHRRYDCGEAGTPAAKGYVRLAIADDYTKDKGYGFVPSKGRHERGWRRRGRHKDPRLDTFVFDDGGLTFLHDLPNGRYLVSLACGDAQYGGRLSVRLNGAQRVPLTTTQPGGFIVLAEHRVTVDSGQLRVEVGAHGRLCYLEIEPATDAKKGSADPARTVRFIRGKPVPPTPSIDHILPKGEFAVGRDDYGDVVRIDLGRIRDWTKVPGIKHHWPVLGPNGETRCFHPVLSHVRDVDGDGRLDLFRVIINRPHAQVARFDWDGRLVWESERLAPCCGDESGVPVEDLDGDGAFECVLSQWAAVYCIDAATGATRWKADLDKGGHPGPGSWDYPMVVGHFADRRTWAVVVRAGLKVHCFGPGGKPLWTRSLKGHTYGHELDRYDIDGDGLHEIFIGRNGNTTALRGDGTLLWEDTTQRNHTDFFAFGDLDGDGRCEAVYDHDGCGGRGPLYVVDALTGKRERSIDYRRDGLAHAQAIACADFRPDLPGLALALVDKARMMLLYDARGKLLWKRAVPTSLVTKADWDGDGAPDILTFTVGVNVDPAFSVWNGRGERLFAMSWLPAPTRSHATMCAPTLGFDGFRDLDGNGRADLLVGFGPWNFGQPQHLFLMEAPAGR